MAKEQAARVSQVNNALKTVTQVFVPGMGLMSMLQNDSGASGETSPQSSSQQPGQNMGGPASNEGRDSPV
jgi:hypothetical protein